MKPKKINYQIEDPCHADWEQMTPETQGRFCSSCSKTVVDFSTMSDFSIVNYLEQNKNQSVCGRFAEDQLEKTYLWAKPQHTSFHFDLKAVALGLALSTFSALPSQAQNSTQIEQHDSATVEPISIKQGKVAAFYDHRDEAFAAGKVKFDKQGQDYESIVIYLMDENAVELASVKASKNGTFKIPLDWNKNPASIRIGAPGYGTSTVYFRNHESLGNLAITLYERKMKMGKIAR